MRNLKHRSYESELMDGADISFSEFHHCLRSLEIINVLTLAYRPTLGWLQKIISADEKKPLHILDAGCGGGDMLRRIKSLSARKNYKVALTGVDLNPWSKKSAEITEARTAIRYETGDIFGFDPNITVDIVICSLFTHHLNDDQIVQFLRWIDARAQRGWFINDLHRHALPYHFIKSMTRAFSRNRLIRHDASLSVARAFTVTEWRFFLKKAGIENRADIQWFFPFRLCVSCQKA